jgi:hypothetical protein
MRQEATPTPTTASNAAPSLSVRIEALENELHTLYAQRA